MFGSPETENDHRLTRLRTSVRCAIIDIIAHLYFLSHP